MMKNKAGNGGISDDYNKIYVKNTQTIVQPNNIMETKSSKRKR